MVVGRGEGQKIKPESQAETSPLVALEWSCPTSQLLFQHNCLCHPFDSQSTPAYSRNDMVVFLTG